MQHNMKEILLILAILGITYCQISNDLDLDDFQKKIKDQGGPDLGDLEHKINETKLNVEQVEKVFREKCEKQGAGDAVDALKEEQENLKNCVMAQVNASQIQEELEEAKKTGSMDEVFAKYCKKWPVVNDCMEDARITIRRCMSEREEKAFNKTLDIVQDLQEFMCYKDGDRLAMFVAEGGVECIKERSEGIKNCINSTVGDRIPSTDDISVATLPTFLFTEEDCTDFDRIRECVNEELDQCKDSTPANIVDAFFKFLKKQMPCTSKTEVRQSEALAPNGVGFIVSNSVILLTSLILLLSW